MLLHKDLFYEISLHCEPFKLSVNKELQALYNDQWFKEALQIISPGKKLFTITNYKDLYKNYTLEGKIYSYYNDVVGCRGIKAQCEHGKYFILTFNGELYCEKDNITTLIDTEVIDISSCGYIKQHVAYFYRKGEIKEIQFQEKLLKIIIDCLRYIFYQLMAYTSLMINMFFIK